MGWNVFVVCYVVQIGGSYVDCFDFGMFMQLVYLLFEKIWLIVDVFGSVGYMVVQLLVDNFEQFDQVQGYENEIYCCDGIGDEGVEGFFGEKVGVIQCIVLLVECWEVGKEYQCCGVEQKDCFIGIGRLCQLYCVGLDYVVIVGLVCYVIGICGFKFVFGQVVQCVIEDFC